MRTQLPPEAPEEARTAILSALKNENYLVYRDSERYLTALGLEVLAVIDDLIQDLEFGARLYLLPPQHVKYQCCLYYDDDLIIHVKISIQDDGKPALAIGCHRHDTGYAPLPRGK
jgi:hypothetical protein